MRDHRHEHEQQHEQQHEEESEPRRDRAEHHARAGAVAVEHMIGRGRIRAAEIPDAPIANVDECAARIHAKLRASELSMQHGLQAALMSEIVASARSKGPEVEAKAAGILTARVQGFAEEKATQLLGRWIPRGAAAVAPVADAVLDGVDALESLREFRIAMDRASTIEGVMRAYDRAAAEHYRRLHAYADSLDDSDKIRIGADLDTSPMMTDEQAAEWFVEVFESAIRDSGILSTEEWRESVARTVERVRGRADGAERGRVER